MAKTKQRLKRGSTPDANASSNAEGNPLSELPRWVTWSRRIAASLLGGLVVYVAYFPSDSVLVENGDALWFTAFSLVLWTITLATEPLIRSRRFVTNDDRGGLRKFLGGGLSVDACVWILAIWMMVAALASCPPGNLRLATNEAWFWIAGASVMTAARRLVVDHSSRAMVMALIGAAAIGMSVHALYQQWISLPQLRAEFLADPDRVLRMAGVDAPPGSASRMVYANRLLDGGPTATFVLANSLAASLLVAVILPIGLLARFRTMPRPLWGNLSLAALAAVAIYALFATHSRSAVAACLIGGGWLFVSNAVGGNQQTADHSQVLWKRIAIAVLVLIVIGALVMTGLLLWGDDEWMSAAPASLEFRLHYWRSTAMLLLDHPWLGAGPGGFQATYLRYRLPVANESIADPHNFLFETLAAGGFVAGALLAALAWLCLRVKRRKASDHDDAATTFCSARWIGYGAGFALLAIWFFGLATRQLPDMPASLFVVPIAVAAAFVFKTELTRVKVDDLDRIGAAILVALLAHLTFSGGWTVPGVALVIWLVVAMKSSADWVAGRQGDTNTQEDASEGLTSSTRGGPDRERFAKKLALIAFAVGGLMLLCLRTESLVPAQQARMLLGGAEDAVRRGITPKVETLSQAAMSADPWAVEPGLWRSEFIKRELVAQGDRPARRKDWEQTVEETVARGGVNLGGESQAPAVVVPMSSPASPHCRCWFWWPTSSASSAAI